MNWTKQGWLVIVGICCSCVFTTEGKKTAKDAKSVLEGIIEINRGNNILMSELNVSYFCDAFLMYPLFIDQ